METPIWDNDEAIPDALLNDNRVFTCPYCYKPLLVSIITVPLSKKFPQTRLQCINYNCFSNYKYDGSGKLIETER